MSVVHAVTPVANRNEVADEVVDDDLENIAEDVGTSYEKSLKTAIKHFNSYLDYVAKTEGKDVFDFETLTAEDVTEDLIGKFGSYLMKKTKIRKCDSALQNLSKVKVALHKKFPLLLMFAPGQPFYSNLRQRITQRYLKQCVADGTQMTDHSVPMREDDLLWMCRRLFRHNSRESMANRCLLVLQWQVMGRISEISRLRYDDINHVADKRSRNSIKINLARVKVGVQQELIVFQHATEWEICPLHALACAILFGASDTDVFNSVLVGGEAAYTNRLLTSLSSENKSDEEDTDSWTLRDNLSSQSARSGSATFANEHPQMQTQWLVQRGGWTLDGIQTIFNYISGTGKTDSRVARALSGWESTDKGNH